MTRLNTLKSFPFYRQMDSMDCGPTCLRMIAKHYGQYFSLPYLRTKCYIDREGVSLKGIAEAAETIEIDKSTNYNIEKVIKELDRIGCRDIQFRFIDSYPLHKINHFLGLLSKSRVRGIAIFLKYSNDLKEVNLINLITENSRLAYLVLHSAKINKKGTSSKRQINDRIVYTLSPLSKQTKETIHPELFFLSLNSFSEAQKHNIGLNRKICINSKGQIKNYLSHNNIIDIINSFKFQEKWFINNDKIEKCKDCQYRYVCLSNSDIEEKEGKYYKVDDCGFDPYTNRWHLLNSLEFESE